MHDTRLTTFREIKWTFKMYDCLVPAPLCIRHCHVRTCKLGMHVKIDGSVMNGVPSMDYIITSIIKCGMKLLSIHPIHYRTCYFWYMHILTTLNNVSKRGRQCLVVWRSTVLWIKAQEVVASFSLQEDVRHAFRWRYLVATIMGTWNRLQLVIWMDLNTPLELNMLERL